MSAGENYLAGLQELLPPGKAFTREPASPLTKLLAAFAEELARVEERFQTLLREGDPNAALELLGAWEAALGLPSPCTGPLATIQERRGAVVARLTQLGGQTPAFYVQLAATLGYTIRLEEFRPFQVGRSRVGDPLTNSSIPFQVGRSRVGDRLSNGSGWLYTFRIVAPLVTRRRFEVGRSVVGEPLALWQNTLLECTIRSVVPAHVVVVFRYDLTNEIGAATSIAITAHAPAWLEFLAPEWTDYMLPQTGLRIPLVLEENTGTRYLVNSFVTTPIDLPPLFLAADKFAHGGVVFLEILGDYANGSGTPVDLLLELYRDDDVAPLWTFALESIPAATSPTGVGQFGISLRLSILGTDALRIAGFASITPQSTQAGTIASGQDATYFRPINGKSWSGLGLTVDRTLRPRLRKPAAVSPRFNPTNIAADGYVPSPSGAT